MSAFKSIGQLALLCCVFGAASAGSEMSGQQRAHEAGQAMLGTPAPRLVLKTIDGESIDLGALYGKKAVYLKFWATWCTPCRQQMPHFQHTYSTSGADLAVIAIDVGMGDSIEAIRNFRNQTKISMPIVFDDGRLAAAFHLRVTPTHIVIGRDGRIRYVGHLADAALDAQLLAARSTAAGAVQTAATLDAESPPIALGDALPAQSLRTLDGKRFELRDSSAHSVTALVFLSPWCESYLESTKPDVAANCRNARLQVGELASDPRVRWIGIASGLWADRADLLDYRSQYKVAIPLTLDATGKIFRSFRVNEIPTILIADSHGRLVRRVEAGVMPDAKSLRTVLEGL